MAAKELKITSVTFEELQNMDWCDPATYFIKDAMGITHFIHTKDRLIAQKWADDNYGKNKYPVKTSKVIKGSGEYSATGSNSRKGFASQLKKTY
jgi:hypothetical protein